MTTPALALIPIASWSLGLEWTRWHVEDVVGRTRCGIPIPDAPVTRKAADALLLRTLRPAFCGSCQKFLPVQASIDPTAPLDVAVISVLLMEAGLTIVSAIPVGIIAQCAADPRGERLHRAVLQTDGAGAWRASYAVATPNPRVGQPRVNHVISRHRVVRDPLELVLWLIAAERLAQNWVA